MLPGPPGNLSHAIFLIEQEPEVAVVYKGKMLAFNKPVHESSMEAFHCPHHWGYGTGKTPVG